MTDSVTIYNRVLALCEEQDIPVYKLEKLIGIGSSTISKWAERTPAVSSLCKIADYFNVSLDYLVGNTEIRSSADTILGDKGLVALQRARERDDGTREKMDRALPVLFDYAYDTQDAK